MWPSLPKHSGLERGQQMGDAKNETTKFLHVVHGAAAPLGKQYLQEAVLQEMVLPATW